MRKTFVQRFWEKVDRTAGEYECWLWIGRRDRKGYGYFDLSTKEPRPSHRISYFLTFGELPSDLAVCHHCDNPSCVNPKHLFLGTLAENNKDMREKGRGKPPPRIPRPGILSPQAKLTEENVLAIRNADLPLKTLAAKFGISISNVSFIKRRLRWAHLP